MSDFEFRIDNLEREQIRARNIEIAKQILDKVGISTDNPLYRPTVLCICGSLVCRFLSFIFFFNTKGMFLSL